MNSRRAGSSAGPISVGFVSLGCPKNLVDSQLMAGNLLRDHLQLAPAPEEADAVIVNTCSFIEAAREESLEAIRNACRLKTEGTCRAVIVAGCLPQRYRSTLREQLPDVDAFVGLDALDQIGDVVRSAVAGARGIERVSEESRRIYEPDAGTPVFSTGAHAYLKVAEGCNHACAFCAIPGIRGRHRSRPMDAIVREAERLLDMGFRELDLISQDVTFYGRDRSDGSNMPELLHRLGGIGGKFWIRLLYSYPTHLSDELLAAMGAVPQVCAYLDVPIQHSHPEILRAMSRTDTVQAVAELAPRLRRAIPGIALRTTCLTGFPGERDEHAQHLVSHVREAKFDHLGVFAYSAEEGTRAFTLPARPSREEAERRREEVMEVQRSVVDTKARQRIGTTAEVLLDGPVRGTSFWRAHSQAEAPDIDGHIRVKGVPGNAGPGTFLTVRFTRQDEYDMVAAVVKEE